MTYQAPVSESAGVGVVPKQALSAAIEKLDGSRVITDREFTLFQDLIQREGGIYLSGAEPRDPLTTSRCRLIQFGTVGHRPLAIDRGLLHWYT